MIRMLERNVTLNRKLPSLDLVRGFESAARNLSFTRAAAELFVTQSAVSRQVKALEEQLGTPLFRRRYRAILLTEAGQMLFRAATEALQLLGDAAARIRAPAGGKTVTVSCTNGFASLWLVPRLADFREEHPDIDLRISANYRMVDLDREGIEMAIRYCTPALAPPGAIRLFKAEEVFPVCSPALLRKPGKALAKPEDLRNHVLLHVEDETAKPATAWPMWLEVVKLQNLKPAGALHFSHDEHLIQAAIDGQGVALVLGPLIRRLIKQGKLVAPFAQKFTSARGYYLITSRQDADRADVKSLTAWLLHRARQDSKGR
jgi:LysR family transcriptional regulator, glycine cleavage system transcriptional activator